jgi:hypothetical protein
MGFPNVTATKAPIIVDNEHGETDGSTTIEYHKAPGDELWERSNSTGWSQPNLFVTVGTADAETEGSYMVTLRPGEWYEVAIFSPNRGPDKDPQMLADLVVYCVWKRPEARALISDETRAHGGTWHKHGVFTTVPTVLAEIGVSRKAPTTDAAGIPHFTSADGTPIPISAPATMHGVQLLPLYAGQHYWCAYTVVDAFGNWESRVEEFDTHRRKVDVQFQTLHIYNDGDPGGHGEGSFNFTVYKGPFPGSFDVVEDFHLPESDIDDWGETDRPYKLGYAHIGSPETVEPGKANVGVWARGTEHDGVGEENEWDWTDGVDLATPAGDGAEKVTNASMRVDGAYRNDDFHFGVDVVWSIDYVP